MNCCVSSPGVDGVGTMQDPAGQADHWVSARLQFMLKPARTQCAETQSRFLDSER